MPDFWIKDGETLLMIGDSITDCGRRGNDPPLGSGYVRMFSELVTAHHPEREIRYINKGIGGNKVTDLKERWRDDVLYHKPDRLTVKIGINDLHSHLRGATEGSARSSSRRPTMEFSTLPNRRSAAPSHSSHLFTSHATDPESLSEARSRTSFLVTSISWKR